MTNPYKEVKELSSLKQEEFIKHWKASLKKGGLRVFFGLP
jgi:hypothetical protein